MRISCRTLRGFPIAALVSTILSLTVAMGDDWPQWRGPQRDGVWRESGIVEAIPTTGLPIRWRARIQSGYSGPVVAERRVFVTDRLRDPDRERVLCFEEASGKPLWTHTYPCPYENMEYGNGPRASPTVHQGKVYTLGTRSHLFCLDAATGNVLWKKDLPKEYDAIVPRYGTSAAPLVEDGLLIVCAGGRPDASVIAFNLDTGKEAWKALKDRPAYSAPIVIERGGNREIIVWTPESITALEPSTGRVLWRISYEATWDSAQVVASPVFHKDRLLCLMSFNRGAMMLKLNSGKPAAEQIWKTPAQPSTLMSTPLFIDDSHFLAIDNMRGLTCRDASSGDELWSTTGPTGSSRQCQAHLTPHGDRVFIFNEKGHLILARPTSAGYKELGQCLLVEPSAGYRAQERATWAHPAYANQSVYARNDRELVCASLAAADVLPAKLPATTRAPKVRTLDNHVGMNAVHALDFSADGKTLAFGTLMGKVKRTTVSTGVEIQASRKRGKRRNRVTAIAFSSDGKLLAAGGGTEFLQSRDTTSGYIRMFEMPTGRERPELAGITNKIFSVVFSPDNTMVAGGGADRTVRIWDAATGKQRAILKGHTDAVSAVAFSTDSRTVISGSWDRTIRLWDTATGAEQISLPAHEEEILAVATSADGTTMASGSADWTLRIWDLPTRRVLTVLKRHQGAVRCLEFSPDGRILASGSGDETVRLWDIPTGKERAILRGHQGGLRSLAFTPDGKTLATTATDDTVKLWDLK